VDILTPTLNQVFKTVQIAVSGTASDNVEVAIVEVSVDNTTWTACVNVGAFTCSINASSGSNTIYVRATDTAGNEGYDEVAIFVDNVDPTVTITTPSDGVKVKKSKLIIAGTATDNKGIMKVEIKINDGSYEEVTGTLIWTYNATLVKGENNITVRATDMAGNAKEVSITVEYKKATGGGPGFELVAFIVALAIGLVVSRRKFE
jgi:hypothetical protein